MTETIASAVERFVAHKRAHGRQYHSEARELALLARFAAEHDVSCLSELTPALLEDFLASRPRPHPRSFNHLLGVVRGLLDWAVTWGLLEASPLQARTARDAPPPARSRARSFSAHPTSRSRPSLPITGVTAYACPTMHALWQTD
jgi:site-specific recombinase XerC